MRNTEKELNVFKKLKVSAICETGDRIKGFLDVDLLGNYYIIECTESAECWAIIPETIRGVKQN